MRSPCPILARTAALLTLWEPDDDSSREFRLPDNVRVEREETRAWETRNSGPSRVEKGRKDATVQAQTDVTGGKHLHAAAGAYSEANFVVAFGGVPGQPESAGHERPQTPTAEFLQTSALPMVDRQPPPRRRTEAISRNQHVSMLMGEQAFDLKPAVGRHIQRDA